MDKVKHELEKIERHQIMRIKESHEIFIICWPQNSNGTQ